MFTYSFLHLDLVDLYPKQLMLELAIEDEPVPIFHLFSFRAFNQNTRSATGQGLQRPSQLTVL